MIRFGTSGWRSILGEEFTFPNARRVVTAIARVAKASGDPSRGLVVASDTRFLNERFVDEASRVLAREGVTPLRADFSQLLDGPGESKLHPGESPDKIPAPDFSPQLHPCQLRGDHPPGEKILASVELAGHDTVPLQEEPRLGAGALILSRRISHQSPCADE